MTKKARVVFYGILFLFAVLMGVAAGWNDLDLDRYVIGGLILLFLIGMCYVLYPTYIFATATDMQKVERVFEKRKQVPLYGYYWATSYGNYRAAEDSLNRTRNLTKEQRTMLQVALFMEQGRAEQCKRLLQTMSRPSEAKTTLSALQALLEGDQVGFEQSLAQVKTQWRKNALLAEASFRAGDMASAERYGEEALQQVKGLQRYLMLKERERQMARGDQRLSYF